jgi:hypothetical protein
LLAAAIVATGVAVALDSSKTRPRLSKAGVLPAAAVSHCPSHRPARVSSSRIGASLTLVPAGATQVVLCRYDGPFGASRASVAHRFRLVATLTLNGARARRLAAELNHLPKMTYRCDDVSGSAVVGFFGYPSGPRDPVTIGLAGCGTATNGHVIRSASLSGAPFADQLEALIHASPANPQSIGARDAAIAGYLWLCGGPAPGHCFRSTVGACSPPLGCSRTDRVVAIGTAGLIIAQQRLRFPRPDGRFRLLVPPGQYAVELLADGSRIHDSLVQTVGVTARAGSTAKVIFVFDVP